jgi:hypothetical protein
MLFCDKPGKTTAACAVPVRRDPIGEDAVFA